MSTCRGIPSVSIEIGNDIIAINGIKYKELYFKQESLRNETIVIGQPNRTPRLTVSIGVVDQQITVRDRATQDRMVCTGRFE